MNKNIALTVVVALILISLSSSALADLGILSFTCNSMSPTANIETGDSMVCEAVIKNTDSQNSVSVNSVTLYTTGGWADAESYAGSGFSTSIGAGASTTASFSGVTANVPGDTHKFLYVDVDDSAYTEKVTDLTVNSMVFKTLTVTPSTALTSAGAEFSVNAYLTAGGSISTASMTISLSGGCSLSTGETATKSIGSMSNNVEVSKSWKVTQGSSTCSITVSTSGTSAPVTITKTGSASVSSTYVEGVTTGGVGGAGGVGVTTHDMGTVDAAGTAVEVSQNDIVNFKLADGVEHTVTVLELTNTQVKIEVSSDAFIGLVGGF